MAEPTTPSGKPKPTFRAYLAVVPVMPEQRVSPPSADMFRDMIRDAKDG